jgi:glycosyltransferase involved in cell wall biosynthesis
MVSAGVNRILRLLRYLPALGWEPTVLAPAAPGEVTPSAVPVVRTAVLVPRALLRGGRRSTFVTSWCFVPDAYAPWMASAILSGRRLLASQRFDAIFSSQPRPGVHVVAASLARSSGLPWLADYRDPWYSNAFRTYASPLHASAHRRLEARVLRRAAAVSAVNQPILDELVQRHPWLDGRTLVVANGFDAAEESAPVALGPGFWFVYTGRLYGREKSLEAFLAALATLPPDVKALFVGDPLRVRPLAERFGVLDRVRIEGSVPHAVALGYQRAADALLLITGTKAESMSSKVFEYLRAGRPVFAITVPHSAATKLLTAVGGATMVAHGADLRAPLAALVAQVRSGTAPMADEAALAAYDMRTITAGLAAMLDRLAGGGRE